MAGLRTLLILLSLLPVLGSMGCIGVGFPTGRESIMGPNYSKEALAFLDQPGTTREETIASLGSPTFEGGDCRVLAYVCQSGTKWWTATAFYDPAAREFNEFHSGSGVEEDNARWLLLIAYDQDGRVYAHQVRKLKDRSLPEECSAWEHSLQRFRK